MMKTAAGDHLRASSALAALFCGLLGGCAPSHPLYNLQTEKQVTKYLDAHCPSYSSGIAHYEALTTVEAKVDPPRDAGANSHGQTRLDADSRQLDRLVAMCATGANDPWVRDAAALWFASDSMREMYSCPSAGVGGDRKGMLLCRQSITSGRSREIAQLIKSSPYGDIRSEAALLKKQSDKQLLDEECALSAEYRDTYKPHCPPDPLGLIKR